MTKNCTIETHITRAKILVIVTKGAQNHNLNIDSNEFKAFPWLFILVGIEVLVHYEIRAFNWTICLANVYEFLKYVNEKYNTYHPVVLQ